MVVHGTGRMHGDSCRRRAIADGAVDSTSRSVIGKLLQRLMMSLNPFPKLRRRQRHKVPTTDLSLSMGSALAAVVCSRGLSSQERVAGERTGHGNAHLSLGVPVRREEKGRPRPGYGGDFCARRSEGDGSALTCGTRLLVSTTRAWGSVTDRWAPPSSEPVNG